MRLVAAGFGDDGAAELPEQFRHGGGGFKSSMLAPMSAVRCQAAATARNAQASRLIAVRRCQEVQAVTWPLSSPLTCFDS